MKTFLENLLKFESTVNQPDELFAIVEFVKNHFKKLNVIVKTFESNNKPSLIITTKETKNPHIFLVGHLDVVPANKENFSPRVEGTRLFARGACDMKGVVAAMIYAFEELFHENPNIDIGLMLTTDEEVGGADGVKYLLSKGYKSNVAFIPDGGNDWSITTDEKGVIHYRIQAKGSSAHGSRPWEGENAVNKCWKSYRDIRDFFREKSGKLREYDSWKPTINLGSIIGGDSANKVPEYAEAKLDVRFPAPYKYEDIKEFCEKVFKANGVEHEIMTFGHPSHTDTDNIYLKNWIETIKTVKGVMPKLVKNHGGSDGRHFSEKGIPVVMSLPTVSLQHIEEEWIDLQELSLFKDTIKIWILKVLK